MAGSDRDEIAKLEALYSANPEGRIFTHLADAHRKAGNLGRARELVERGLRLHSDYSSAHVVLGRILLGQGEGEAAQRAFHRVLALDPENRVALRELADLARKSGRSSEAAGFYREILLLNPGDEEAAELLRSVDGGAAGGGTSVTDVVLDEPQWSGSLDLEVDLEPLGLESSPGALDLEAPLKPLGLAPGGESLGLETFPEPLDLDPAPGLLDLEVAPEPGDFDPAPELLDLEIAPEPGDLDLMPEILDLETSPEPLDLEAAHEPLDLEAFGWSEAGLGSAEEPGSEVAGLAGEMPADRELSGQEAALLDEELLLLEGEPLLNGGSESVEGLAGATDAAVQEDPAVVDALPGFQDRPESEELAIFEELPAFEDFATLEDPPLLEEPPQFEELSTAEDLPLLDEFSMAGDLPLIEDHSVTEELPAAEDLSAVEELPAAEDLSFTEESPAAEGVEDPSLSEELPAAEGVPAGGEVPAVELPGEIAGDLGAGLAMGAGDGYDLGLVVTETMADLYASQGLTAQAADVYRELLRARPEDEGLQAKLLKLARAGAAAQTPVSVEDRAVEEGSSEASAVAASFGAPAERSGRSIGEYLGALLASGPGGALAPSAAVDLPAAGIATTEAGDLLLLDESMVVAEAADPSLPEAAVPGETAILQLDESMVVSEGEILQLDESMVVEEGEALGGLQATGAVAPSGAPAPEPAPVTAPTPGAPIAAAGPVPAAGVDEEGDEDLEVFRAWLRNLKR